MAGVNDCTTGAAGKPMPRSLSTIRLSSDEPMRRPLELCVGVDVFSDNTFLPPREDISSARMDATSGSLRDTLRRSAWRLQTEKHAVRPGDQNSRQGQPSPALKPRLSQITKAEAATRRTAPVSASKCPRSRK